MNSSAQESRSAEATHVGISLRPLGPLFGGATLFFTAAGAAVAVAKFVYNRDRIYGVYALFNVGTDANAPTWYASFTLLSCSALLAVDAITSRADIRSSLWWVLAAIFLLLWVDEVARLHETLGGIVGSRVRARFGDANGLFYYSWVIPGAVFAFAVALMYVRFLRLPPAVRYGMLSAGALFVGGALFVEMFNAQHASVHGADNLPYQLVS